MPRDGSLVYFAPPGTKGVTETSISSSKYNALVDDLVNDLNAARPVTAGGTGATNAAAARTALGIGNVTVSASAPSGGVDGDVWYQV